MVKIKETSQCLTEKEKKKKGPMIYSTYDDA